MKDDSYTREVKFGIHVRKKEQILFIHLCTVLVNDPSWILYFAKSLFCPFSKIHNKNKENNYGKKIENIEDINPYIHWDKFERNYTDNFEKKSFENCEISFLSIFKKSSKNKENNHGKTIEYIEDINPYNHLDKFKKKIILITFVGEEL